MSFEKTESNRVKIFDTTLRDGEQSPGCSMTGDEKLRLAKLLADLGVDIIEAGFPNSSPGDFEAVKTIAEQVKGPTIAGLARAVEADILRTAEAVKPAETPRIHTFISTSPVHMKYKLRKEPDEVLEMVTASVSMARNLIDDIEWSPEDATRTEPEFLVRCIDAAVRAGATTINIPDTVGYLVADEYSALLTMLLERVDGLDQCTLSTHCHNDLGVAVANSLDGVVAGARQIECTINGIGERAGNASLEEVVMALQVRKDRLPYWTNIDSTKLVKASKTLAAITGFSVQPNKAIVGANAFAHESGIHQDGMLKNAETYEIMTPESVGWSKTSLPLGPRSGRAAFRNKLEELGFGDLGDNAFRDAFERFLTLADRKKEITDEDVIALIDEAASRADDRVKVAAVRVTGHTTDGSSVEMDVLVDDVAKTIAGESNGGAVETIFQTLKAEFGTREVHLRDYSVSAISSGADAQAQASVTLEEDEQTAKGQGSDLGTLTASAKAYAHALNKLAIKRQRASK